VAPSAVAPDTFETTAAAAAHRALGHLQRACSRDQDDTPSTAPARRARSYLNRRDSKNSMIRQSQEALQAGQLKNLQKTRSQLKEEQRLAQAKVEELQQGCCRVTAVPDTDALFAEVSQMLRTQGLPNVEIKSISRTVTNEKYAQAYLKNRGSKAERVLWLASPAVDTRQILESEHCLDYRHASFGQLGRGIYGADLAVYADTFSAHETESGVKQLLLCKGIVGKPLRCFVGSSENAGFSLSSLMRTAAPPGHDSTCAPEAALCQACAGTQPGCKLEERCTCPFMPVGYQSEYGRQIRRRVSSPLYCLLPPAGHIQDKLLMEPSELEPYVLALPVALVEYVNPESKACSLVEPKWWHPDVANVLQRYRRALADDRARRSAALESALAHRDCLEARAAEAELDLAVEREDKRQLEKTIKALQSERDRLQTALNSATSSPEHKFTGAIARDGWCQHQLSAAWSPPSLPFAATSPDPTAMMSPAHALRGDASPVLKRNGSFAAGSEDSDHPEEYWTEEFSEMPQLEFDSGIERTSLMRDEHAGKRAPNVARNGVLKWGQLRTLRRKRVGLDFRSVSNANAFIKTLREGASPTKEPRTQSHHQSAPFAPSTLRHCVVLGDPVESELMDAPELIEIRFHQRPSVPASVRSALHDAQASSPEQDASPAPAQPGIHAASNAAVRQESTPPRPRHAHRESHSSRSCQRDSISPEGTLTQRSAENTWIHNRHRKTSRATIDLASGSTTRHGSANRRRRVKFRDEMDGPEPSHDRKSVHGAPQMEDVKSILKLSHAASL